MKSLADKISQVLDQIQYGNVKNLYEPIGYMLSNGGKRVRPAMVLMAAALFDDEVDKYLPLAKAVEIFHNFTLVHDDIMDNAALRRGNETVFKKWGMPAAILSGDAMMILAYRELEKVQTNSSLIFNIFNKTALEICEGQQLDMDFEKENEISVEQYLQMISKKTAVLLAAALKMGALNANADMKDADLLYECGYNLGIAFQLKDDLLDAFPVNNQFGKQIGGDILASKKTFLYLKTLQELTNQDKNGFIKLYHSKSTDKLEKVIQFFRKHKVEEQSEKLINDYFQKCNVALSKVNVSGNRKKPLRELIDQLQERVY